MITSPLFQRPTNLQGYGKHEPPWLLIIPNELHAFKRYFPHYSGYLLFLFTTVLVLATLLFYLYSFHHLGRSEFLNLALVSCLK